MSLRVRELEVVAGGRTLHRDVALDVTGGERLAIAGPSGSGKTTLLRLLAGLISPPRGDVQLDGQSMAAMGYPSWRRRVVLLQQRPVMIDAEVLDNLRLPFEFATAAQPWPEQQVSAWLAELGLDLPAIAHQAARELSVGEQQRLALVRALSLGPAVLLADEPTSALDATAATAVEGLLRRRCAETDLACVVVSHDAAWLTRFCDRTLALQPALTGANASPVDVGPLDARRVEASGGEAAHGQP